MENHHFQWENPLFLWPFSIANYHKSAINPIKPTFSYGFQAVFGFVYQAGYHPPSHEQPEMPGCG